MDQTTAQAMLEALTPELIARFRDAVATGRWPDGRTLTAEQRETCMQAVLLWEHEHLPAEERTGYMPPKAEQCAEDHAEPDEKPVRLI